MKPRTVVIVMGQQYSSTYAFQWYLNNMYETGDYVILVHTVESPMSLTGFFHGDMEMDPEIQTCIVQNEYKGLAREKDFYQKMLTTSNIQGTVRQISSTKRGEVIVAIAKETKASFIVTGSTCRSKIKKILFGSTEDYLIRHSTVPVINCQRKKRDNQIKPIWHNVVSEKKESKDKIVKSVSIDQHLDHWNTPLYESRDIANIFMPF